eukprot:TRINITY_DN858_c1_g2_i1.p2 TRINITY_DN858_c1_g2~~TRINITY_DN858_c1_g2_i1.p2  ORF type:complete len:104 (-),score=2.00 TRINITY_DN858_c1_g2_i1:105-416(-)
MGKGPPVYEKSLNGKKGREGHPCERDRIDLSLFLLFLFLSFILLPLLLLFFFNLSVSQTSTTIPLVGTLLIYKSDNRKREGCVTHTAPRESYLLLFSSFCLLQ